MAWLFQGYVLTCLPLSHGKGKERESLLVTVRLINILDSQLDSTVISLGASHWTAPSAAPSPFPSFFTFLRVESSYKYDNTRGASSSHEITPFDPATLLCRHSPSMLFRRLSKGSYPYRPSCITRRLLSPLYDIGNPKTRIKVPPPLRRRRDVYEGATVERPDATSRQTPSAFANRRSKECAYKLIGTVVSGEVAFPLRRNRIRRVEDRRDR